MNALLPEEKLQATERRKESRSEHDCSTGILRRFGVVGMDSLEPVILAALAMETPLLLIGPHGTAKSLLLNRLSVALNLTWRHYNTSLLNYDDLVGYPLPDENGRLRFVETPASIWNAEVVFLDEISRARPDMQNRLFSIIHEKRVQGMPLEQLRHRWAAMNPPVVEDTDESSDLYEGSEALDPALADRFNFVIEVPRWQSLTSEDRNAVIRSSEHSPRASDPDALCHRLTHIREQLRVVEDALGGAVAEYVRVIIDYAQQMGILLSGRRASMLYRNILAVHAACSYKCPHDPRDTAWLTLINSLPQRAQGTKIDSGKLLISHNEAWKTSGLDQFDERRLLSAEPDPVRRAIRACSISSLTPSETSAYVADGLAEANPGGRHALALYVMNSSAIEQLNAAVAEQVADLQAMVVVAQDLSESIRTGSPRHLTWQTIVEALADLPSKRKETVLMTNLLAGLFAKGELSRPEDVPDVLESWRSVKQLCAGLLKEYETGADR